MKLRVFCLLLISFSLYAQSDLITKVITLNYISGSQAEKALRPLLRPGESISTSNQKLIVNVSKDTLTKLRTILMGIDVLPVVFNIAVHQGDADWLDREQQTSVTYTTYSHSTAANDQMVQVESGKSALISTGSNVPVVSSVGIGIWQTGVSYQRMQVKQGFLLQPSLQGERVRLKIRRFNSQVDNVNAQQVNQQFADTTTIVPQHKWVKLGATGHADLGEESSYSYTAGNSYKDRQTVYVKVQVVKNAPPNNSDVK